MCQFSDNENHFDVIIIGTGIAGLTAGLCLAREGKKILILEKHYVPGGWCHSFYLNKLKFSPGVHYIGNIGEGESTRQLFEGLGVANDLVFFRMNPNAFEHCIIENKNFKLPSNLESTKTYLCNIFPEESNGIKKYLDLVKKVSYQLQLIPKMDGIWDNITIPFRTAQLGKYGLFSLKKVIDWHIKNPLLKAILNIQCGDHGLSPNLVSFPLHCAVMDHYSNGGYYPLGGGAGIVKAFTKSIKVYGGQIKTSKGVQRILVEGTNKKRAVGVETESGEKFYAETIISNADPTTTYKLVGYENLSKKLLAKLSKTRYSLSSIMMFLILDINIKETVLGSSNIWVSNNMDLDLIYENMKNGSALNHEEFSGFFISCTTAKDPCSFNGKHHCLEVITFIDGESFFEFNNHHNRNSEKYNELKQKISSKILNSLQKIIPDIRNKIVKMELGTPLTNKHYINSTFGSTYGTEKTLNQIGPFAFSSKTALANLYLTGASILSHGVAGASNSGLQTAAKILGCNMKDLLLEDPNQKLRTYEADDDSKWPEWILQKRQMKKDRAKR